MDGTSPPVEEGVAAPIGPRCAHHGDVAAPHVCARCGDFLCQACARVAPWDAVRRYCSACLARVGAGGQVPWEDRSLPVWTRFWRTVGEVTLHPWRFGGAMPLKGYQSAITFLYQTVVFAFPLQLVVVLLSTPGRLPSRITTGELYGTMVAMLVGIAVVAPMFQFAGAGWLHLHLALFGGRGGFEATYRLSSYFSGLSFAYLVLSILGLAVKSKVVSGIILIAYGAYALVLFGVAATRVHRLHPAGTVAALVMVVLEVIVLFRFVLWEAVRGISRTGFGFGF